MRYEVAAADRYLLLLLDLDLKPRGRGGLLSGSAASLSIRREATSGTNSAEEALGVETSLYSGSPDIGLNVVPEVALALLLPWLDICECKVGN